MEKDLKIRISIDKKTGELKVVNGELGQIANTAQKTNQSVNLFGNSLMSLGAKVGGIYAVKAAFDAVLKTGFAFNKNMEDSIAGLTALTVATSSNISAMGNHLSIAEKYNLAQKEAIETATKLQAINAETPHTLEQTNQIYKAMYVSMKKAGASNEQMINLTKKVSIAAGAAGIEFNSLLAGVDGLATGTVLANSDLGRFLNSLGLSNKKLKESKNVVETLNNALKDFRAVDNMTTAVSNLDNAWSQLTGDMTKELFNDSKDGIKDLTKTISDNKADIVEFGLDTIRTAELVANGFETIYMSSTLGYKELAYTFKDEIGSAINFVIDELQETNNWWADTWIGKKAGLEKMNLSHIKVDASQLNEEIVKSKKHIYDLGKESDVLLHKILTNTQAQKDYNKEAKKGKTDELVKTKNEPTVDNKSIEKQNAQQQKAYNLYTSIMGTGYDKWLQDTSDKMALLAQSGSYTNEELQKVWEKLQRDYNLNINADALSLISDPLDTLNNKFMNMYENIQKLTGADAWSPAQLQKFYSVWQKSAEKIGKENKKQAKYDGIGSQAWTAGLKGQAKQFANINNAINDLTKDQSKYNELSKEDKALNKDKYVASQVDGYSALAGAMSGVFQEGSSGAQAFQAIQATLGIVNAYTGITAAWASAPFPANLPAVAAASASLLPMISTLTSLGGSGGSSGDGTSMSVSEIAIQNTKDEYKPITGRLDRQIALLQSIDKNGSASFLGLDRAEAVYKRDYDIFTQESLSANNSWAHSSFDAAYGRYGNTDFYSAGQDRVKLEPYLKEQLGYDIFSNIGNTNNPTTTVNMDALSTDDNFVKLIALLGNKDSELAKLEQSYQSEGGAGPVSFLFDAGWDKNGRTPAEQAKFTIDNLINDYQDTLSEFTLAVNDSIKELTDGADSFKDDYDKITNSQYYANKKIVDAFNESDNAVKNWIKLSEDGSRNGLGLSDYIKDQIANIDDLQSYYTRNISDILLSQKPEDMQKQLDLVRELETKTGKVFEDGARDALDYLDSINLVAETMATSNANIKSWQNSFKTDKQKTSDMLKQINLAEKLDLKVANNYTSLDKLFDTLKGGIDGLTDVELNFLNANKDLLDSSKSTVQNVFDAWNGSLSYLSLNEKSTLSDKFYDLSKTSGSTIDSVEAARLSAEAALKSAKTQEDYIPVFDRYIHELQDNAPKNTLDDVVDELKIIADKVSELEETTRRVAV